MSEGSSAKSACTGGRFVIVYLSRLCRKKVERIWWGVYQVIVKGGCGKVTAAEDQLEVRS